MTGEWELRGGWRFLIVINAWNATLKVADGERIKRSLKTPDIYKSVEIAALNSNGQWGVAVKGWVIHSILLLKF